MKTFFCVQKNGELVEVKNPYSEEVFQFQGSADWHEFRSGKTTEGALWPAGAFGASSAAALMNEGYNGKNYDALLKELSGFKKPPKVGGLAVERGNENEDAAREAAEMVLGVKFAPVCAIDEDNPIHRVSFDGVAFDGETPVEHLEIKIPFKEEKFLELSTLPDIAKTSEDLGGYSYYFAQIQMQLALLPLEWGNLFIYYPEKNLYKLVKVKKDQVYIQNMLDKLKTLHKEAWELYNGNVDEEDSEILEEILEVKTEKDVAYRTHSSLDKTYKSLLKDDLGELLEENKMVSNGHVAVAVSTPAPSIDWKKLAETYLGEEIENGSIPINQFLKKPSKRYTVLKKVV